MGFFLKRQSKALPSTTTQKRDITDGIYTKCEDCKEVMPVKELQLNLLVCPKCQFHHKMSAPVRIKSLVDNGTFRELNSRLKSKNPLAFPGYEHKLQMLMDSNKLNEAVVTGVGKIGGQTVAIGVMDSNFLMGSMGSVVGEKITRLIEVATAKKLPLCLVCASGGARMQEGIYSLMQMAKTSAALAKHHEMGLFYLSVLTHPTMGGVTASFATLGDIIIAEDGAAIGFAGRRVIEQTIKQELPDHFQTSKFLQEKGLVDKVVSRCDLKDTISLLIEMNQRGDL